MPHLTQSTSYLKFKPKVYPEQLNFDWNESDYMMTSAARKELAKLNKPTQLLSEKMFEKAIDIFEKLRVIGHSKSMQAMCDGYTNIMQDHKLQVTRPILERVYREFWQRE